jgi:hypothetical protein
MFKASRYGWVCGILLCTPLAFAQAAADTSVAAALGSLTARAGVVFAGEVTAVRPVGGVVEIDFRIAQNLKGAAAGSYTLREWAGLWADGQRRYWVGERAVIFLHDAGKSGLSSPVDGMDGVLPITPDAGSTLSVEVQRLRTRVLRPVGMPMADPAERLSLTEVAAAVQGPPQQAPTTVPPVDAVGNPPIARPISNPDPDRLPVRRPPVVTQPLQPFGANWREDLPQNLREPQPVLIQESPNDPR